MGSPPWLPPGTSAYLVPLLSSRPSEKGPPPTHPEPLRFAAWERLWSLWALCLARCALCASVGAAYILGRKWLTVDPLVRNYRRVENPIAFLPTAASRAIGVAHLHAQYAAFLAWPQRLCCDWSYKCVVPLDTLLDPQAAGPAALYMALAYLAFRALAAQGSPGRDARLRFFLLMALVVGPFFPASNVLFWVGTYIGERLLYLPVAGFAAIAAGLADAAFQRRSEGGAASSSGEGDAAVAASAAEGRRPSKRPAPQGAPVANPGPGLARPSPSRSSGGGGRRFPSLPASALVLVLLVGYGARNSVRNVDWASDDALFDAAIATCPDGAKILQNVGVMRRRDGNNTGAMALFHKAMEVDPLFCEPHWHLGTTGIKLGTEAEIATAVTEMEKAVDCIWTQKDAVEALHQVFQVRAAPHNNKS